jgi:MIP family channel proteins
MRDTVRPFVAELIGTLALVFVGGGAIMMMRDQPGALIGVALAHGLVLSVMVSATMHISGHFNPAVTMGFLATRRIEPLMAGIYIIAQFLGAMIGALLLRVLMPEALFDATRGGGQSVSLDITGPQAIGLEALGTFFLTFSIFGTAVHARAPKIGGFAIGLTLGAVILAIGPLTGASLNPARSFGPAVVSGTLEGLGIYFVGPIIGAVLAALVFDKAQIVDD